MGHYKYVDQSLLGFSVCENVNAREAAEGITSIGFRDRQIILSAVNRVVD